MFGAYAFCFFCTRRVPGCPIFWCDSTRHKINDTKNWIQYLFFRSNYISGEYKKNSTNSNGERKIGTNPESFGGNWMKHLTAFISNHFWNISIVRSLIYDANIIQKSLALKRTNQPNRMMVLISTKKLFDKWMIECGIERATQFMHITVHCYESLKYWPFRSKQFDRTQQSRVQFWLQW